jgi:hypothetical protein
MTHPKVLQPGAVYTFSKYSELPFDRDDILADLNCTIENVVLTLPRYQGTLQRLEELRERIQAAYLYTTISSEQARREFLIAPIISELCRQAQSKVRVEYPVVVNDWLRGTLDYCFQADSFLVIEAKRENLYTGFTQLAAELIALDQWTDSNLPILYGAITTGEIWRFGLYQRQECKVIEDRTLYRVPEELEELLRIMVAILLGDNDRKESWV